MQVLQEAAPPDYDTAVDPRRNNYFPDVGPLTVFFTLPHSQVTAEPKNRSASEKTDEKSSKVTLIRVFAFASPLDLFLILVGIMSAVGCGSVIPIITVRCFYVTNAACI